MTLVLPHFGWQRNDYDQEKEVFCERRRDQKGNQPNPATMKWALTFFFFEGRGPPKNKQEVTKKRQRKTFLFWRKARGKCQKSFFFLKLKLEISNQVLNFGMTSYHRAYQKCFYGMAIKDWTCIAHYGFGRRSRKGIIESCRDGETHRNGNCCLSPTVLSDTMNKTNLCLCWKKQNITGAPAV